LSCSWALLRWGCGLAAGFRGGGPAFQVPKDCEAVSANLDLALTDRHRCGPARAAEAVTC